MWRFQRPTREQGEAIVQKLKERAKPGTFWSGLWHEPRRHVLAKNVALWIGIAGVMALIWRYILK
jgi:hypothetical protein